jgi:hypothetical protein
MTQLKNKKQMKKKLEAELISIAHRILKLKTKSDVRELHLETQKLYEKLSVLLFIEENFTDAKPTIGNYDIEKRIEEIFNEDEKISVDSTEKIINTITETKKPVKEIKTKLVKTEIIPETEKSVEEIIEAKPVQEKIIAETEKPIEEIEAKPVQEEIITEEESTQEVEILTTPIVETKMNQKVIIEDIKVETDADAVAAQPEKKHGYFESIYENIHQEPIFERLHKATKPQEPQIVNTPVNFEAVNIESSKEDINFLNHHEALMDAFKKIDSNSASLNDKLKKTIDIGLNDKIAFEKNLFNGSSEDLNRVISQLSTYDSFNEAKNFIDYMIKPDYNNWKGKEDYVNRFMEIVESKFN